MGLILLAGLLHAQQWERLPLNVGHLDVLVRNPYNPAEIVGYLQTGYFYRSTNGGASWQKIIQGDVPFKREYIHLSFDAQSRLYLIVAGEGIYRSTDHGVSWASLFVTGKGTFAGFSQVQFGNDGSIYAWEDGARALYKSTNDGRTWIEIGPRNVKYSRDFYIEPDNPNLIVVLEREFVAVTDDGGASWMQYPLPSKATSLLFPNSKNGQLSLLYAAGGDQSDIYNSSDTGRTWQQWTRTTIHVNQGDCAHTRGGERYFFLNDSTEIFHICNTLQRSTDSGRTFQQVTNFRVDEVVQVGEDLVASVPLRGLIRSTDYGDSWSPVSEPPELFRVSDFEFAHAYGDTLFVLMGDWETNSNAIMKFLESDDGGYTWDTLSGTSYFKNLFVDAGRPSRYYLSTGVPDDRYGDPTNRYMLLSGVAGQIRPDTVLVTTSFPRPTDIFTPETFRCVPSERFPGWIYATRNTNSIGWSSDRGMNWEWHTLPISCSSVHTWPSQSDPRRILVHAYEENPIPSFSYEGLHVTPDGGLSFVWVNRSEFLGGQLSTTEDDRYFMYSPPDSSSTDYGRTWSLTRAGLDSNTTIVDKYQSHGSIIALTNAGMYIFDDERWKLLRDSYGNSIWDDKMEIVRNGSKMHVDYTGKYIYVAIPFRGLFRIATLTATGVVQSPNLRTCSLVVYPNPTNSTVKIMWDGADETRSVSIRIYDVLTREVWRFDGAGVKGWTMWDCTGPDGRYITPGLYIAHLKNGQEIITTNILLLR